MRLAKLVVIVGILLLGWRPLSITWAATNHALVISQVRGQECCDRGSLENLKFQVELFKKKPSAGIFNLEI